MTDTIAAHNRDPLLLVGALSLSKLVPAVLEAEFDPFTLVQRGWRRC
ncbi:hypothetical protein [Natrialba chahannaoensis]|nr:hypothetical protein [Natrialba chahannaoensis]